MSLSTHIRYIIDEKNRIISVDLDCSNLETQSSEIHLSRPEILIGESFLEMVAGQVARAIASDRPAVTIG